MTWSGMCPGGPGMASLELALDADRCLDLPRLPPSSWSAARLEPRGGGSASCSAARLEPRGGRSISSGLIRRLTYLIDGDDISTPAMHPSTLKKKTERSPKGQRLLFL